MKKLPSQPIRTLIPQGKNPEQFQRSLAQRFVEVRCQILELRNGAFKAIK